MALKILFEDDYFLAIDKPAGLVVDKAETNKDTTLEDLLVSDLPRKGIVHRLDKDTSGVLLVAKTQKALEGLQKQFQDRVIKKEYLALVHGTISEKGVINAPIARNPEKREKFTILDNGKEAVTEYEPLKQLTIDNGQLTNIFSEFNKIQMRKLEKQKYGEFTLVKCKPKTGRTHQIRVHLKYIRYPIVSDKKYVGRKMYRLDHRWCTRMFLHAQNIGFYHPETGEWLELESPLPEDLKKVLENFNE